MTRTLKRALNDLMLKRGLYDLVPAEPPLDVRAFGYEGPAAYDMREHEENSGPCAACRACP